MSFDPEQPRDEKGRWADSASAGGGQHYEPQFGKNKKHNLAEAIKAATMMGFKASEWKSERGSASAAVFSNGALHFNSRHKFWADPVGAMKAAHEQGQLSSDSPAHVIHHEIGHAMYDPPDNFLGGPHSPHGEAARSVSKYAGRNPKEFVSEVHAGMMAGKQYPAEVMQAFAMYARKRKGI